MLVAIDIGNTHTVVGIFKGRELLYHWRIMSDLTRTEDEIGAMLLYLFEQRQFDPAAVDGVCISSVVPDLTPIYQMMSKRYLNNKALIIHSGLKLDMGLKYLEPKAIGADRLCNAVAGIEKYGRPLIIIDFGTATTFDCINAAGEYLGGAIAPGIQSSFDALHQKTAKLPRVDSRFPVNVIGRTTEESIQSGIMRGSVHLVEGLITEIKEELGGESTVIATGGLAGKIAEHTSSIDKVDYYLSLDGIASIYYKNVSDQTIH
ncbi:MAG TPA: type III pantothenate kinase [Caldithrix abyssi]|uniref:Type III pantothenate kinase n=1 Tax=Caldithrix abyssi TaxID=187145 RepID=A0A7V4U2R5_CALAY|nr:type III pantothenate kinase [Caldithrix abyssi]